VHRIDYKQRVGPIVPRIQDRKTEQRCVAYHAFRQRRTRYSNGLTRSSAQMLYDRMMTSARLILIFSLWFVLAGAASAQPFEPDLPIEGEERPTGLTSNPGADVTAPRRNRGVELTQLCPIMQFAAADHGLPIEFFARLIWQESRLRPDAIGPVTRGGERAQGIAQFMPSTAAERSLLDPFDPARALPKAAELLRELRAQFGNLGLAAAAYNAGPQRIQDWLAGKRTLPSETLAYVRIVTGNPAEDWKRQNAKDWQVTVPGDTPCVGMTKLAAKPASQTTTEQHKSTVVWAVQLIGDRSETNALASYNQIRKKYQAILGAYEPVVVRTTVGMSTAAIWHRIRIEANTRAAAEALCSKLRAAGGSCLVQRI
jgi:hypothetical protein